MTSQHYFSHALLPDGWAEAVQLTLSAQGHIEAVSANLPAPAGQTGNGPVIAGIPNAHSHAFQRVMCGLTEHRVSVQDSFWSWRETMYRVAGQIGPDELRVIAAQLYVEMVKAGYTSVGEFHYLHHAPDGSPYSPPDLMCQALLNAAGQAGIGLTLLPVLYQYGGFDQRPLTARQRRFGCEPGLLLELIGHLDLDPALPHALGVAVHSLRAASAGAIERILGDCSGPVHIHIAEQPAEVQQCLAATGKRPLQWLLDRQWIDANWALVHATHITQAESDRLAATGAVTVLCPTTEANLGDGLFPLPGYVSQGGLFAIGSDSHISVDPREELRWLEYGQRLMGQSRNLLGDERQPHSGRQLLDRCLAGGARALGQPVGQIAVGARADLVVLDETAPALAHTPVDQLLDSWIFCGAPAPPRHVMVAGRWLVRDGRHRSEGAIREAYDAVAGRLRARA